MEPLREDEASQLREELAELRRRVEGLEVLLNRSLASRPAPVQPPPRTVPPPPPPPPAPRPLRSPPPPAESARGPGAPGPSEVPVAAAAEPPSRTGPPPVPQAAEPPPVPPGASRRPSPPPSSKLTWRDAVPPAPPRPPGQGEALPPSEAVEASPLKRKPALSLEQRIGAGWLNRIGIVVLILAAVFFFQYAASQGWVSPLVRVLLIGTTGAALCVLGEWTRRKGMTLFASGVTGGGIALLYASAFAASPKFYGLIGLPLAFGLMCAITALGAALSVRARFQATAFLVQIGGYLTPLLLSSGRNEQVVLLTYLLVLAVGFLVVAFLRRWPLVAGVALLGTVVLFGGWYGQFGEQSPVLPTVAFGWTLMLAFAAYALLAFRREHLPWRAANALLVGAGVPMAVLFVFIDWEPGYSLANLLALDVLVLGVGVWARRRGPQLAALGWTAVGVPVLLIGSSFDGAMASPGAAVWVWAFVLLLLAEPVVRSLRGDEPEDGSNPAFLTLGALWGTIALVHVPNASATPAVALGHLLVLGALCITVALWRGWSWVRFAVLAWTAGLLVASPRFVGAGEWDIHYAWIWAFVALFVGELLVRSALRRNHPTRDRAFAVLSGVWAAAMFDAVLIGGGASPHVLPACLLGLTGVYLAIALWRGWRVLRIAAAGWVLLSLWIPGPLDALAAHSAWAAAGWTWAVFALLLTDVIVNAPRARTRREDLYNAAFALAATVWMYVRSYLLLSPTQGEWMGLYTAVLGGGAVALGVLLQLLLRRSTVGVTYFIAGLVLVTLAAPLQFDTAHLTIVWTAEALFAMLLGRHLRNRILAALSVLVMLLAVAQFAADTVPALTELRPVLLAPFGVPVTWGLVLAGMVSLACLAVAAVLRGGGKLWDAVIERNVAIGLVVAGEVVWAWRVLLLLEGVAGTWWLLVPAVALLAAASRRRSPWLTACAGGLVALVVAVLVLRDTWAAHARFPQIAAAPTVVLNWTFAAGLLTVGVLLWLSRAIPRRLNAGDTGKSLATGALLAAVLLGLWMGSFEIDRGFLPREGDRLPLAEHMALSLWWSLYAVGLLVGGFLARRPLVRYVALGLFALTAGKVFLVELAHVETGYRIVSLMALGALLVGASYLYQRFFRTALALWDRRAEPSEPDAHSTE